MPLPVMALSLPLAGVVFMAAAMLYSRFLAGPLGRRPGIPKIWYKLPFLIILVAELVLSYRVWAGVELSPSPFYFLSGGGWSAAVSGEDLKNAQALLKVDAFGAVSAMLMSFVALVAGLRALSDKRNLITPRKAAFFLLTCAGIQGMFYSSGLAVLFVFMMMTQAGVTGLYSNFAVGEKRPGGKHVLYYVSRVVLLAMFLAGAVMLRLEYGTDNITTLASLIKGTPSSLAAFVLMIVAYAKMISGYAGLKKSPTFPEGARRGASTLFACSIWLLVGYVLGGIPVIGDIIEGLIAFVVFFVMLSAWGTIKAAAPDMTAEEEAAFRATEVPVHKQRLGDGLVAFFLTVFIARLFTFIYDISSLGFFYECVVQLIILGIFIWLLASLRSRLHVVSLIGLILILVNVLESIVVYSFIAYDPSSIPTLLGNAIINISMTVAYLAGMMLFVWGSYCSLGIKVTITAYVVLSEIVSRALPIVTSEFLSELEPEKINMVYRLTITAIAAVFLVLTFIFVSLWKKEPERTDATATYVHA